jgi:hypothetical protein
VQFGDWLNLGKMKDTWYLVCLTENKQFKEELEQSLGRNAAIRKITDYLFHIDTTMNRTLFEKSVKSLIGKEDSAAIIYPTSKGLKHKELQ